MKYIICTFQALEQQAGASDDFQEIATEEKEASKRKFTMDAALEDKICDLYDLYVDVLFCACNACSDSLLLLWEETCCFMLFFDVYWLMVSGPG